MRFVQPAVTPCIAAEEFEAEPGDEQCPEQSRTTVSTVSVKTTAISPPTTTYSGGGHGDDDDADPWIDAEQPAEHDGAGEQREADVDEDRGDEREAGEDVTAGRP
jgi:hypothetical protein